MQQRLSYVDGLRAIAVLAVVVEHVGSYLFRANSVPGQITRSGMHGVDLFFVISGFCLSYPVIARLHEKGMATFDAVKYLAHRAVRILPPYYIAIVVLAASYVAAGAQLFWPDVARQFFFLDSGGAAHMLNPSFWTLPIEFRWYAAFPFLLWLWIKAPRAFLLLGGMAMISVATKLSSDDLLVLPAFMLGIVAAHLYMHQIKYSRIALAAALLFAIYGVFRTPANWDNCIHPAWQMAAFCFVVGCGSSTRAKAVLSSRWITWLGTTSYSIYLIHFPVVNYLARHGLNAVAAGVAGIAAGVAFWWLAERPFTGGSMLRQRIVAELTAFLPKWLKFFQIPVLVRMGSAGELPRTELRTEPELALRAIPYVAAETNV